jgi:hypothetical protein
LLAGVRSGVACSVCNFFFSQKEGKKKPLKNENDRYIQALTHVTRLASEMSASDQHTRETPSNVSHEVFSVEWGVRWPRAI